MTVLSDATIREHIRQGKLILQGDTAFAKHCAYELRAGRVVYGGIVPPAQHVTAIDLLASSAKSAIIQPTGVAWVRSREKVHIPANMAGIWIQTNSLSRRGVLLLNSTLVEPGYSGYLSAHFVNFGSSPVSISANTTIAKLVFVILDTDAKELVDSTPFKDYDEMIEGLAAQSSQSFLRISEIVPDLSKAADLAKSDAQREIQSLATQSIEQMKGALSVLRRETFLKAGGAFALGLALAVVFSLYVFPYLRGIDIESTNRIRDIVSDENASLIERLERLQSDLEAISRGSQNGN